MWSTAAGSGSEVPGSTVVEEHEHEGRSQEEGAEGEGPGEPDGGDHEPEREGSYAGARVEGRVPECAAEPVFCLGDASHHQDEAGVLEQPEPGPEEHGPGQQDHASERKSGHSDGTGDETGGEQEARVPAVAEASSPPAADG